MRRLRWPVTLLALAALAAGCSGDKPESQSEQRQPGAPTSASTAAPTAPPTTAPPPTGEGPISKAQRAKLAAFLDRTKTIHQVGERFELTYVDYTSHTDAAAEFLDDGPESDNRGSVIATTDDNWAHTTGLLISWDLADLVDYLPLGRGVVAIKAKDQSPPRSYPPLVLYPNGKVKPLLVTEPRTPDADSELLEINNLGFFYAIGEEDTKEQWAADVDAGEIFPLVGSPPGDLRKHVPGRGGAILTLPGYRSAGAGVWRFNTSTDHGHSWGQTEVRLPPARKLADSQYPGPSLHALGPGHLQAIALTGWVQDGPSYLSQLWRTTDEQEFRRVPLPWERMPFGGIAFASDGALLLSEVEVPPGWYCQSVTCNQPGRVWRLPPGGTEPSLLSDAPDLFGPFWSVGIQASGGWIVARTDLRTIALSKDGYTWKEVSPGQ
jgi:hypothetical protein